MYVLSMCDNTCVIHICRLLYTICKTCFFLFIFIDINVAIKYEISNKCVTGFRHYRYNKNTYFIPNLLISLIRKQLL